MLFHASTLPPRSVAICALLLPLIGCGSPERGEDNLDPWGGGGAGDNGSNNSTGEDAGGSADDDEDAGSGRDDGGSSAGDGGLTDTGSSGGEEPPPDEPPGSPYAGGWDIGDCQDDIVATGTAIGEVVPDFTLYDQFGDQVRLYDFCHKAVYIVAGAFW